mmetsp:Transcript_16876/g.38902  ORF Transcript_16876/g.38902 Transcript_16876/m.38902 type:complete len:310 (-) Transcript_16876:353-1282(-)
MRGVPHGCPYSANSASNSRNSRYSSFPLRPKRKITIPNRTIATLRIGSVNQEESSTMVCCGVVVVVVVVVVVGVVASSASGSPPPSEALCGMSPACIFCSSSPSSRPSSLSFAGGTFASSVGSWSPLSVESCVVGTSAVATVEGTNAGVSSACCGLGLALALASPLSSPSLVFGDSLAICANRSCSISFSNRGARDLEDVSASLDFSGFFNKEATGPQRGQQYETDFFANRFRSSEVQSKDPTAPSAGVGRKAMRASRIRRIPQAGCHSSGWKAVKLRQIFVWVSKRPEGVKKTICGGLKGYSGGSCGK